MLDDVQDLQRFLPEEYKNDPRMAGAVRAMLEAGKAIVLSFLSIGVPIPEEPELNKEMAMAAGLKSVRQFEMVRLALVGRGVLQKADTIEGVKWSLTAKGRVYASRLMDKMVKTGAVDQAIVDEYARDAREVLTDDVGSMRVTIKDEGEDIVG